MATVLIGYPERDRVQIGPLPKGSEWSQSRVEITTDGFTGAADIYLDVDDVVRFRDAIEPMYKNLSGKAEFSTLESQFSLCLEMDSLGHVTATGFLTDSGWANKLTFEFSFDQTFLGRTVSDLNEALSWSI